MPTRYRTNAYTPAPSWLFLWKSMHSKLEPNAAEILQPIGFYEKYDLEVPAKVEGRKLAGEEKAAIECIATGLTIAADAAHQTPAGVVKAWLDRIAKNPELFRSKLIPPEVHWLIVSCYRRGSEPAGHQHSGCLRPTTRSV
jgi:hypothetical protein